MDGHGDEYEGDPAYEDDGSDYSYEDEQGDPYEEERRRRGRPFLWLILLALFLLAADGAYVGLNLATNLNSTANQLERAKDAIREGREDDARDAADEALASSGDAAGLEGHPAFALARVLPWVGSDARAVASVARAAKDAANAASEAVALVGTTSLPNRDPGTALYRKGVIQLDLVRESLPLLQRVRLHLASAQRELDSAPVPHLELIGSRLSTARETIGEALDSATTGEQALRVLPELLGEGGTRRYFLAFQTPSEARGTGGLIGFYGILRANDGRIDLEHVAPIGTLAPPKKPVPAPRWFALHYGLLEAQRQWQQVNLSPNFPVVSSVLLDMYEASTGSKLDGVVAMDPLVLGSLTKGTGPIPSPELGTEITEDNASEVLLRDSYRLLEAEQDAALKALVGRFFEALQSDSVDFQRLMEGFGDSVANEHLKVFSQNNETQRLLEDLAIDGWSESPNLQAVWHTSASPSKVDYFLKREINTEVQVLASGGAQVKTTVSLANAADPKRDSFLADFGFPGDPPGLNRMYLHFLMPQGARLRSFEIDGKRGQPLRNREDQYPIAWEVLRLRAGDETEASVSYEVPPEAFPGGQVSLTLQPQATAFPDRYSVRVVAAPGVSLEGVDGDLFVQGELDEVKTVRVQARFRP